MKIYYCPQYSGLCYFRPNSNSATLEAQVLETQGLLSQLALHAGIHVEIPPYPVRLADYHRALIEYDEACPENMFHASISIDSMSVAKTLLGWRDAIRMAGWNQQKGISRRFDTLGVLEEYYLDKGSGLPLLLKSVEEALKGMCEGTIRIPQAYKELDIVVPCSKSVLPDFMIPVLDMLEGIGAHLEYEAIHSQDMPQYVEVIEFTEQYQAEAWVAHQQEKAYDVWINKDNKRLDNWLHMSGKPVAGSDMLNSNPQISQMFLLALQLFQRPLNVNAFLQYLYLPECPLPWKLATRLASTIVREGGFYSSKVLNCIQVYLDKEFKEVDDKSPCELTKEERLEKYSTFLPFDLLDESSAAAVVEETSEVEIARVVNFMKNIMSYAGNRAVRISAVAPYDLRIEHLHELSTLCEALLMMLDGKSGMIPFRTLQQWAQSLYDSSNFCQFNAQVNSRFVINSPSNIVTKADKVIWCDFWGDVDSALSTNFLSPREIEVMQNMRIRVWDPRSETAFKNFMLQIPLHQTLQKLTLVACKKIGATDLPIHPLRLQLPKGVPVICGDDLFASLPSVRIQKVDNHRAEDSIGIFFDAQSHKVTWREQESFSALENLLQNPLDYFMNYSLGFSDKGPTEIVMSTTKGNVAHEAIEMLFTADRGSMGLSLYMKEAFESAWQQALARKGALLLLPEHHLDCDSLKHQLQRCVYNLAEIIETNNLIVVKCEQEEVHNLEFEGNTMMKGYIDMVLKDTEGKPVIFDLKWTSIKDKHAKLIEANRDAQLAIYQAMLQKHPEHPEAARTAFFVMPKGIIVSADDFMDCHFQKVNKNTPADIMDMLRKGYATRRAEIAGGFIETSSQYPIADIQYANTDGVFPLETEGKRDPKKVDNKYSDYKCFTC